MKYDVADYSINKRYENISFGDLILFKRNLNDKKWSAGINISQECDNIIRIQEFVKDDEDKYVEDIARKNSEYTLLRMELVEIDDKNQEDLLKKKVDSIWPIEINGVYYTLVPTYDVIRLDTDILDLCSLNLNGKASLGANVNEALKLKSYHSKIYFDKFIVKVNTKINDRYEKLFSSEISGHSQQEAAAAQAEVDENDDYYESNFWRNILLSLSFQVGYDGKGFALERICRIESKRSLRLVYQYINNLGRIGVSITPGV